MSSRPLALVLLVLLLAGCGGGGAKKHKPFVAPTLGATKGLVRGYGASDTSAGQDASYTPSGKILADSNFRPWDDGFNFENYGNDAGPQNMTPAQVEDLFGAQVCVRGSGKTCELLPTAKQWMDNQNAAMSGGHCMGFSVTALRLFDKSLSPSTYGAPTTAKLAIQGNLPLQERIAEDWTYQTLAGVTKNQVVAAPNDLLKTLEKALQDGSEQYTVGITNATGGHAITPFAVEDRGSGKVNVLVYDNNFPGITRTIEFDTTANTWLYHGGPNPKELGETYQGDAHEPNMELLPTKPGTQQQPCPFCNGASAQGARRGYSVGSTLGKAQQYDEITLTGSAVDHGHLLITDEHGHQTGYDGDHIVNEIPGAQVVRNLTIQNWREAPEPAYRIPTGLAVAVSIDGSGLSKTDKEELTLIGPGDLFDISDIELHPKQTDTVEFKAGNSGLNYETDAKFAEAPLIGAAIVTGDGANTKAYLFHAAALGVTGHSSLAVFFVPKVGGFGLDTGGTAAGTGDYFLTMQRATPAGFDGWDNKRVRLRGGKSGQEAIIQYTKSGSASSSVPVLITGGGQPDHYTSLKPDPTNLSG